MDGARRDNHHEDDQGRAGWAEQTQGCKQASDDFSPSCEAGKQAAGPVSESFEETTCPFQTIAAKPSECLLATVRRHADSDYNSGDQKTKSRHDLFLSL
jgi:hypothetical protein